MKKRWTILLCLSAVMAACSAKSNPSLRTPDMEKAADYAEDVRLHAIEKQHPPEAKGSAPAKSVKPSGTADPEKEEESKSEKGKQEKERQEIEKREKEKREIEKQEKEKQEKEKLEKEKKAQETAQKQAAEKAKAEQEKAEAERVAQEKAAAEKAAADKAAAEQAAQAAPPPAPPAPEAGLDFAKLAPSTQMSFEELTGDSGIDEDPDQAPPAGTYTLEVDTGNNVMIAFAQDGSIARLMRCTTGKSGTRTPHGEYRIGRERKRFGYFDEFDCYAQYWTQVVDGIFIHSLLYNERDASSLIRSSYRNIGRASSHGCIRLTVPDARWVYQNIAKGTTINIIAKEKDEALRAGLALPPIGK